MNKEELVKSMAEKASGQLGAGVVTQKIATACLEAFLITVEEQIEKKDEVSLVGFGTFKTAQRAERRGRNPQTQETMIIPATTAPVFKPGKYLKEAAAKSTKKGKGKK